MLPQGRAVEAPQYHVVFDVVHGVLDGHIMEQATVCTKDLFRPGPHLMSVTKHDPRLAILFPQNLAREEFFFMSLSTSVAIFAVIALSHPLQS